MDPASGNGWQEGIKQRVDQLGRYVEGRLLLTVDPDAEAVAATEFLDDEYLENAMARASGAVGDGPVGLTFHAGVSRFVRHYTGSLSIPALVGLAEGVGVDVSPARCTMLMWKDVPFRIIVNLADTDVDRCEERPTSVPADGRRFESLTELRNEVCQKLYAEHIAPLITRIADISGISAALLWTNAAEWIGVISEAAREYLGDEAAEPYLADRRAILATDRFPGIDLANPVRDRLDWTPLERDAYPYEVATRRLCCLTYLLDDRYGRLCASCPQLPLDEKVALVLERHGASVGTPGGPAERQAIERGLQRPALRKARRRGRDASPLDTSNSG
jgi:ferric iron reductase protein FhuF